MRIQEEFAALTTAAQENLSGVRVIRAYGQEEAETTNFQKMSIKYLGVNMDLAKVQALFMPLVTAAAALLNLVVLYFGGIEVMQGRISIGTLVAFFAYLSMMLWPLIAMGWVISLYQRGMASLERIDQVINTVPDVEDGETSGIDRPMKGKIEFRNLDFSYNGKKVLENINLTINPGETIGLVGQTGSGKTTLVSLLPRLFPINQGQLFIDNVDINDWNLHALRRQIGYATQEPFLFSDTVRSNIAFGSDDIIESRVVSSSKAAALDKDVDCFPRGYSTIIGERGITLSGGQKQRTTIARAILVEPKILILDDATSAVDTQTEDEINQRIKTVLKDRTAIIISHRVSSVKDADVIIYLRDGQIVEQGSHEELMQLDGHYAELYRRQLLERELEVLA
jgi:ATP-binding cassette subfamily B protein